MIRISPAAALLAALTAPPAGLLADTAATTEPLTIEDSSPMTSPVFGPQEDGDFVPDWAKDAVWYQIFPERFRNGDPSNDPMLADIGGAWPDEPDKPWAIHPWTSDWYKLQPWEEATGGGMWYNIQRRRYGGDLQGILDKLDYLEELGVNAIYLNPIFMAPSMHKYDGATYHHVDPTFGPDPEGDRALMAQETPHDPSTWVWTEADKLALKLIEELHARGIRVIFDGVFNHMGINSWAFQDVKKNQRESPYADWFTVKSWDDPEAGTIFDYEGWFGVSTLPELREDENGIVAGPKDYIFHATRRWMDPDGDGDPSDGIDGWRLDVAFCVAHPFWKDWRKHVKSINPDAYLTAEVIDPIPVLRAYLEGDEFDAVMNYNFAFTCAEFFYETSHAIGPKEFDRKLEDLRGAFHPNVAYVQQNLMDSHDTNRVGSHIVNRGLGHYREWGDYFGKSKAENPAYDTRKPNAYEKQIQALVAIMKFTYVGAPMIYYGGEVGMWGANDPCSRKPMIWDDMTYDPETHNPDQTMKDSPDSVEQDKELLAHYRRLIAIRNAHPALRRGSYRTVLADNDANVFAFVRELDDERIYVVLNNSDGEQDVALPVEDTGAYTDLLAAEEVAFGTDTGVLDLHLEGKSGRILKAAR
ncbi:MAG: glycoside hydrolase family 13 protein [Sumerlaeia bacterium]